jgi:hypothetical protein
MKKARLLLLLGASLALGTFSSCSRSGAAEGAQNMRSITGAGNGAQVFPSPVTGAGGATLTGSYNPNNNMLSYTINYTNLSGVPTMGSFYVGGPGAAGYAVGTPFTITGTTGSGSVSGSEFLSNAQETELLAGNYYYNLSTATYANGEVRGQVVVQ